jgi:hypothetical protein
MLGCSVTGLAAAPLAVVGIGCAGISLTRDQACDNSAATFAASGTERSVG